MQPFLKLSFIRQERFLIMNKNKKTYRIMMLTGEVSGDIYGSRLYETLQGMCPGIDIFGVGGERMKAAGMNLLFDSTDWGTIGFVEALKKAPRLFWIYLKLRKILKVEQVDCIVALDYPGFNMALVRAARRLGIPSVYFFPPAKWARHPWEVKEAARTITKVCSTFESTAGNYRSAGANVEFVGHPIIDECRPSRPKEELFEELGIDKTRDLITLMPGSREREVEYLLPTLLQTAEIINSRIKDKPQFIVPVAKATYEILKNKDGGRIFNEIERYSEKMDIRMIIGRTIDVLSLAKVAVIASGTATLEAAYLRIPMILIYRVSFFTGFIARKFKSLPPYFGLPNLILRKKFIPEIIQEDLKPERVALEVMKILSNKEKYYYIKRCLDRVSEKLGKAGVNKRVAEIILKVCENKE